MEDGAGDVMGAAAMSGVGDSDDDDVDAAEGDSDEDEGSERSDNDDSDSPPTRGTLLVSTSHRPPLPVLHVRGGVGTGLFGTKEGCPV